MQGLERKLRRLRARRHTRSAAADVLDDVSPERAVGLELRLAEPLVGGALVRKARVIGGVTAHAYPLGRAVVGRLDVQQPAGARGGRPGRALRVGDRREAKTRAGHRRAVPRLEFEVKEVDADAEIDVALAHRVAELLEFHVGVATRIDHDDAAATAPHHLIEPEVVEVAAIGEVDPAALVGRRTRELLQSWRDAPKWAFASVTLARWIAEPPPETDVEQHQQEADERRGVVTLVGAQRRTGDRHGGAEGDAAPLAAVPGRGPIPDIAIAAIQPRHRERFRFALLPGGVAGGYDVERSVDHVEEPVAAAAGDHSCQVRIVIG